jgi:hypothetical protein
VYSSFTKNKTHIKESKTMVNIHEMMPQPPDDPEVSRPTDGRMEKVASEFGKETLKNTPWGTMSADVDLTGNSLNSMQTVGALKRGELVPDEHGNLVTPDQLANSAQQQPVPPVNPGDQPR